MGKGANVEPGGGQRGKCGVRWRRNREKKRGLRQKKKKKKKKKKPSG